MNLSQTICLTYGQLALAVLAPLVLAAIIGAIAYSAAVAKRKQASGQHFVIGWRKKPTGAAASAARANPTSANNSRIQSLAQLAAILMFITLALTTLHLFEII